MDIELARTFLEIMRSGSFIAAADRLHVTQTTVTARVSNLEEQLGCKLFVRNRSGARLTANGQRFSLSALQLVQTWDKARLDLPLPEGHDTMVTVGAEMALWNPLLFNWVSGLRHAFPELVIHAETAMAELLVDRLSQGTLDVAILHRVEYAPGLQIEQLFEEKLILVAAAQGDTPYVYVDWGPEFRKQHDSVLPGHARPALTIDFGPLALQYLLEHGGSGYFRTRVVSNYLESGELRRVPQAPEFSYPVYLIYSKQNHSEALENAISVLRQAAGLGTL
jgi:DNA-binding transcriptional LysR family regulator